MTEIEQLEKDFDDACKIMGKKAKLVEKWYKKHYEGKYVKITDGSYKGRLAFVYEVRHSSNMRLKICYKRDRTRFLASTSRFVWGDKIVHVSTRYLELEKK